MVWKGRTSNSVYIVISHGWFQRCAFKQNSLLKHFWYVKSRTQGKRNSVKKQPDAVDWMIQCKRSGQCCVKRSRYQETQKEFAGFCHTWWTSSDQWLHITSSTSGTTTVWTQVWSKGGVKCVTAILADQVWLVVFVLTLSAYIIPLWKAKKISWKQPI